MTNADDQSINERLDALEHAADQPAVTKEVVKQALKEWLDEKYAAAGRCTVSWVTAWALAALVYFILWHNGWRHETP